MKKRLLSLVLCLVMVFSLLPAFGMSARAEEDGEYYYEELDKETWLAGDEIPEGDLYAKIDGQYVKVTLQSGDVYSKIPENGSVKNSWTAQQARDVFLANPRTGEYQNIYYMNGTTPEIVKESKEIWFSNIGSNVPIHGNFTRGLGWNITALGTFMDFPGAYNDDENDTIYTYSVDSSTGEPRWHVVYSYQIGDAGMYQRKIGGYWVTLYYYTGEYYDYSGNNTISNRSKTSTNQNNWSNASAFEGTTRKILSNRDDFKNYGWRYGLDDSFNHLKTHYTAGNLYIQEGKSSKYNRLYTDSLTLAWPNPGSEESGTYSGPLYYRDTGLYRILDTASGDLLIGSTAQNIKGETVYNGKLYLKQKDEAPEPTPPGVDIDNEDINILNPDGASNESFKLQKELTPNDQGSYDITMQSYSTAATKTINLTEKVPTDFIVVVDQSGSMDYRDMPTGDPTPAGTKTLEDVAQEGTAEKDKTGYYVKDGDNYYRVYAKSDYLMEYHEPESKWTKNIIEEAGYDLSWFQGKDEASFGLDNQYYYKTKDGIYRPVHVTATGKIGTYYIEFYYLDANGKQVDFVRPSKPVYKNVFGSVFGKYGPGSLGYSAVNAAVLTAYPRTTAYTYSTFLGVTTGMYVNYPMYTRHVGYTQLCYRDVNGVEHIVKSTSGLSTAEYCDANGNAVVAEGSNDRMEYTNLYTYGTRMKRIDALKAALNEFVEAVANETDARDPDHPGEKTAVDNRIAIVGFSSDDDQTHGWGYRYYDNTEILTTGLSGTDGVQMREAGPEDYAAALVAATDGVSYGEDHVNPTLTNAINAITANGGTQPEYGFEMAQNILLKRNSDGRNTHTMTSGEVKNRNTIVIFFTDGRPGDYDDSDQYSEANQVIDAAKDVKALGAKVFSIGVFGESDGNPLTYDASNDKTKDVNGREVSVKDLNQRYWKYLGGYVGISQDGSCLRRQWRPNNAVGYTPIANDTIYDYMSVASSNYPNAKKYIADEWLAGTYGGTYTEATEGVNVRSKSTASAANQFYRMASDQKTLVSAFEQSITYASSLQVDTGVVSLDSNAVFRDVVNVADFDVSNATYTVEWQPIKVDKSQVSPAHPSAIFPDDTRPTRVMVDGQPVPADGVVEYSGFDYGANYVSLSKKTGYKLVVTIHGIVPRDSMYDNAPHKSNADPSNTVYACGIYQPGSTTPELQVESPTLRLKKPLPQESHTTEVAMTKTINGLTEHAQPDSNGQFTIQLSAYAKGNSKTGEQSQIAAGSDIVIVVDKSDSMGNYDNTSKTRYERAMDAINAFIDVADNSTADHRIAIVEGGHKASASVDYRVAAYNSSTRVTSPDFAANADQLFKSVKTQAGDIAAAMTALGSKEHTMYLDETFDAVKTLLNSRSDTSRKAIVIFLSDGKSHGRDSETFADKVLSLKNDADVFGIRIDAGSDNKAEAVMKSLSSQYPDATWVSGSQPNPGNPSGSIDFYQDINAGTQTNFSGIFNDVTEIIDSNISLDSEAYLLDVIDLDNLEVSSMLSEPEIRVYTQRGTYVSANQIEWVNEKVPVDDKVDVTYNSETGAVRVTGFDFSANHINNNKPANAAEGTVANQGKKLIVEIGGLVPVHPGTDLTSNVKAGVYDKENDEAATVPSPKFDVGSSENSRTYVIDFSAPMTLATEAKSVAKMEGTNGEFSLFDVEENGQVVDTQIVYQFSKSVGGQGDLVLSGVDKAFGYGKLVQTNMSAPNWCTITTIPANNVYFDDDFTAVTTMQPKVDEEGNQVYDDEGNLIYEPRTDFKNPINVGDGYGYNVALESGSNYTENEERWDNDSETRTYYFTFTGTGADVYATTEDDGAYVQAALFSDPDGIGADACVKANRVDGSNVTMKQYSDQTRYNVPTLHFVAPTHGTYTIRIKALAKSNYRLDGIRIYNALADQTVYTNNNVAPQEANASFFNLRELLINNQTDFSYVNPEDEAINIDIKDADHLMPNISDKILYVDNADGVLVIGRDKDTGALVNLYGSTFEAYKANSPENEIYLGNGQGIAFTIANYGQLMTASNNKMQIQVGLSVADNSEQTHADFRADGSSGVDVKSPVDMYYTITPVSVNDGQATFVIKNSGTAVLAITDLKVSGTSEKLTATPASGAQVLSVNDDAANEELTTLQLVVNSKTLRALADIQVEGDVDPANSGTPEQPEVTPEPTPDPTPEQPQNPSFLDAIRELLSSFVQNLFSSIGRLFGH